MPSRGWGVVTGWEPLGAPMPATAMAINPCHSVVSGEPASRDIAP
ncbi:hypothetical protein A176_001759 [Myxococcus hansupus]|uniref:Uncharacterized protein n=1 Tax=Pseudomyxococcus hansupus TaxID=1297742 RepID=A0A0H4XAB4_9BACT|nr:hypothetical protein [Myxococcus hansupus]AKQ64847.1 hypothetical protein A176_001759 [Myxococcus hansupus]